AALRRDMKARHGSAGKKTAARLGPERDATTRRKKAHSLKRFKPQTALSARLKFMPFPALTMEPTSPYAPRALRGYQLLQFLWPSGMSTTTLAPDLSSAIPNSF